MDDLFSQAIARIGAQFPLSPVELPEELRETRFPLGLLEMQCYNWRAPGIRKLYAMRLKIKVPALDILGMAIYPEPDFDLPIFCFDLSCAKKKIVTYINAIPLLQDDDAFRKKYIDPFTPARDAYAAFPPQKMPEWMLRYKTSCTIYSMPDRSRVEEIKACVLDYLAVYLGIAGTAVKIVDAAYRSRIEQEQNVYINELLTKDNSQKMLAKILGAQKTRRIFHEVLV
jgi:phytochromobilin:ferredoxin oxidoreductase